MSMGAAGIRDTVGRNLGRLKDSRAVWLMALLLVLFHLATLLAGWSVRDPAPWEMWGLSRDGVWSGRAWQLLTHAVIHGSWSHLMLNVLALLVIGSRIEHMVGGRVLWFAVMAGALAGGVSHLVLGQGILVGFSAAAFALWMLLIGLSPDARMWPFPGPCVWLGWGVFGISLLLALCDPLGGIGPLRDVGYGMAIHLGPWIFRIGHACHAGGCLAGWLVGLWILRPRISLEKLKKQRARREARHALGKRNE